MKLSNALLLAAVTGIVSGAGQLFAEDKDAGAPGATVKADADKHACKSLNSCQGKGGCKASANGCKGKNDCKTKGGCATVKHDCKTKNDCKGQGGCATTGKNDCKGKNDCQGKGGCKVPAAPAK